MDDDREDKSRQPPALDKLFGQFYDELRAVAAWKLSSENPNHTLQPTDLVHEAYRRLKNSVGLTVNDRVHFMRLAAGVMWQHLVDHAREKKAKRRGGHLARVTLVDDMPGAPMQFDLLELAEAMEKLEKLDNRQADVIQMRHIAGLTIEEVADELGISKSTVTKDARVALAFLRLEMSSKVDQGDMP